MNEFTGLIHPTAEIHPKAMLGAGVRVGAHSYIGANVSVGDAATIARQCSIEGRVRIGNGATMRPGCVIAGPSRERSLGLAVAVEDPMVEIGAGVWLGEYVTVHQPMRGVTFVGSSVAVGPHSHIAHDCHIESAAVLAPHVQLGGYVYIGHGANLGIDCSVHPRIAVGGLAMCGMGATVTTHVQPGAVVVGSPARYLGPNDRGFQKAGLSGPDQTMWRSWLAGEERQIEPGSRLAQLAEQVQTAAAAWGRDRPWTPGRLEQR